jgi:HK97 gp10 family phage protein
MASDVRIDVHDRVLDEIRYSDRVRVALLEAAEPIVASARVLAPKLTGAGSASIHSLDVPTAAGWTVRIGWDGQHYYMKFQDQGTHYIDARHFLEIALEGASL